MAAASATAFLALLLYFFAVPASVNWHAFMQNHTSEVFCSLATVALLTGQQRRYRALLGFAYWVWVIVNVASSPFFIATYVVPALVGTLLVTGNRLVPARRTVEFATITLLGAACGIVLDAGISYYVWPIRGDSYPTTLAAGWRALRDSVWGASPTFTVIAIGLLGLGLVGGVALRTRARVSPDNSHTIAVRIFLLAFAGSSLVTCAGFPVARGAFLSPYELRYLQQPVFLSCIALAGLGVSAAEALGRPLARWLAASSSRARVVAWHLAPLAAGVAAVGALALMRGPFSMTDDGSVTAPMVRCFAALEKQEVLRAGVSNPVGARYLNAARHARTWSAGAEPIVELNPFERPSVSAPENNLIWLQGSAQEAVFNFVVVDSMSAQNLEFFRQHVGEPSRIARCPIVRGFNPEGEFGIWVYDDASARQRLREFVLRDPMTASFAPWSHQKRVAIDLRWGISSPDGLGRIDEEGRLSWRRDPAKQSPAAASTGLMFLPSGNYELRITSVVSAPLGDEPVVVALQAGRQLGAAKLRSGTTPLSFLAYNRGGATSGAPFGVVVLPGSADSIRIDRLEIELIRSTGPDLFRLFR